VLGRLFWAQPLDRVGCALIFCLDSAMQQHSSPLMAMTNAALTLQGDE
jgi:hypothetical protein